MSKLEVTATRKNFLSWHKEETSRGTRLKKKGTSVSGSGASITSHQAAGENIQIDKEREQIFTIYSSI